MLAICLMMMSKDTQKALAGEQPTAPGWYPDEPTTKSWASSDSNDLYRLRWWDGSQWGEKKYSQEPMVPAPPSRFDRWFLGLMVFLFIINLGTMYLFSVIIWGVLLLQFSFRFAVNHYRRHHGIKMTLIDAQRSDIKTLSVSWVLFCFFGALFLLLPNSPMSTLGAAVILGLGLLGIAVAIYACYNLRDPQALYQRWDKALNKSKGKKSKQEDDS